MSLIAQRGGEIIKRLRLDRPTVGIEVGVYDGRLSAYLLREAPYLTLIMLDRWAIVPDDHSYYSSGAEMAKRHSAQEWKEIAGEAYRKTKFGLGRGLMLRAETPSAAGMFPDQSFEFAFIDADHSEEATFQDIKAWWPKIRAGGFIGGHDWDHPETHVEHPDGKMKWGVRQAVERFFGPGRADMGENRTWWVRKLKPL